MTHAVNEIAPVRREPVSKGSFAKTALLCTSVASGAMLGLAMPNLITGSLAMVAIKSVLMASSAVIVCYGVNRVAVERGAPLAVRGYKSAGFVSVLSIAFVGAGLWSTTYSGMTFNDVEQLRIEAHGEELSAFVSGRTATAAQSAGIVPVMNAVVSDLAQKRDCEIAESCISGRSAGGNGPVAKLLTAKYGRAAALSQQAERGDAARRQALDKIDTLYSKYQSTVSSDLPLEEKRRVLRGIDLTIRQAATDLDEAIPVPLLAAYGEELKAGAEIEGRPDVSQKLSGIMREHGQAIIEIASKLTARRQVAPAFPQPTGVADTFFYIGHFLPIAAIAGVMDLVFPISFWLLTLVALHWQAYSVAPPRPRPPHPEDEFYQILLSGPESKQRKNEIPSATDETTVEAPRLRRAPGRPSSLNGKRPDGAH